MIDLHALPPVAEINGARIRELTGDATIPDDAQVSPVGVNRRSSLDLTHWLAKDFEGVIHWARDTEIFQSILKSFVRLDLESVSPPELPEGWDPEVVILAANGDQA